MAVQKAKPVTKKAAVTKAVGAVTGKSKITKAAVVVAPKKVAAKKTAAAAAAAEPKNIKKPAAKKAVVPAAKKKAPAPKSVAAKPAAKKIAAQPTPEERYRMVQTAAYFIAERNGFSGCSADHWVAAELEIAGKLDR